MQLKSILDYIKLMETAAGTFFLLCDFDCYGR